MCKSCQYLKLSVKLIRWNGDWGKKGYELFTFFHICFILTTCPQAGIRIGTRLWMFEDYDEQQCNAPVLVLSPDNPSADWPLGRPSCCSSLDRDSLSTLCFAALEKMKLSTATLALMSPLSAKWITVNNAKCYTNNDLLIPKHLYILQEILHTLCCMFHCNYVSVFMDIIVLF